MISDSIIFAPDSVATNQDSDGGDGRKCSSPLFGFLGSLLAFWANDGYWAKPRKCPNVAGFTRLLSQDLAPARRYATPSSWPSGERRSSGNLGAG